MAYAVILVATVAVVGGLVYDIANENHREEAARDLDMRARANVDLAASAISDAVGSGGTLLTKTTEARRSTTADVYQPTIYVAGPELSRLLDRVPDYVLLLDPTGHTLYTSFVRQISFEDALELAQVAMKLPLDSALHPVQVAGKRYMLSLSVPPLTQTGIGRVVAGVEAAPGEAASQAVLTIDLVLLPVVIALSLWAAYAVSGRAFRPIDVIMNEVEAITDGRSLHRRLVVDGAGDEMRRLSETLNQMIARLESSFSGLRRFTADASHELKTPLTVLRADVERALTTPSHSTDQLVALEEALQETRRMSDLVDSLLTLARADEGRYDMIQEPVALDPVVHEVFESALILGEDADLAVSLLVLEPTTVLGDPARLRQLFMNLVMNAIKYTPRGGRVELSLSHRLDGVTFSVRDTGIGIAPSDLPHIFERFWRADRVRSRSSERGGFGLGLAISQWIAQAHGGSIVATSRLGRGSMFTVHLPTAAAEANAHAEAPAPAAPTAVPI